MNERLEAINYIRQLLGLPSVSSLNARSQVNSDINNALDRATRQTLTRNPHAFAQEKGVSPNSDREIIVSQYLRVGLPSTRNDLSILNGKIWDKDADKPYNQPLKISVVNDALFEDIASYQWREAIALNAAEQVAHSIQGATADVGYIRSLAKNAEAMAFNQNPPVINTASYTGAYIYV